MAEVPHPPADEGGDNTGTGRGRGPEASSPRLTHLVWAVGIVLVVLFVVMHLTGVLGPGDH